MDSDKNLKREDELTELSKVDVKAVLDEKTGLQKQGHSLLDKAKETLGSIASKLRKYALVFELIFFSSYWKT